MMPIIQWSHTWKMTTSLFPDQEIHVQEQQQKCLYDYNTNWFSLLRLHPVQETDAEGFLLAPIFNRITPQ